MVSTATKPLQLQQLDAIVKILTYPIDTQESEDRMGPGTNRAIPHVYLL